MDGSSFINPQGEGWAGYAVVTLDTVIEAKLLPQGTSPQKTEFIALTQALELSEGNSRADSEACKAASKRAMVKRMKNVRPKRKEQSQQRNYTQ